MFFHRQKPVENSWYQWGMVAIVTGCAGVRCLWHHTAMSNSRFKSNVVADVLQHNACHYTRSRSRGGDWGDLLPL